MFRLISKLRVRYDETDTMGFVYHGKYAVYYEYGRTEMLRHFGLSYKQIENNGLIMPITKLESNYLKPAKYDDVLFIHTIIKEMPKVRMTFEFEIFLNENDLINTGKVQLVTLDAKSRRPVACPKEIMDALNPYFT